MRLGVDVVKSLWPLMAGPGWPAFFFVVLPRGGVVQGTTGPGWAVKGVTRHRPHKSIGPWESETVRVLFCAAVGLQGRDHFELCAWQASSWKRHSTVVATKLNLLRTWCQDPRTHSEPMPQLHDPRGRGLCLARSFSPRL